LKTLTFLDHRLLFALKVSIMDQVFVGVEGYTLTKEFILKELTIVYPNGEFNHYILKNPPKLLSPKDSRTVRYTTKYLNQLSWFDGDIIYSNLDRILKKIRDLKLYTYGCTARNFLEKHLPNTIIVDTQYQQGVKIPSVLESAGCCRNHPARYCSKAKALYIKDSVLAYESQG